MELDPLSPINHAAFAVDAIFTSASMSKPFEQFRKRR